jgi:hypothetical protein
MSRGHSTRQTTGDNACVPASHTPPAPLRGITVSDVSRVVHNQFAAVGWSLTQNFFYYGAEVEQGVPQGRVSLYANVTMSASERRVNRAHQSFARRDTNASMSEFSPELFELLAGNRIEVVRCLLSARAVGLGSGAPRGGGVGVVTACWRSS